MSNAYELKGNRVVATLLLLTGFVGALFIILGPKATEKSPGILHVGIRYADERSIEFTRYSQGGPGARIEFITTDGESVYQMDGLKIGRNLVPIETSDLPSADYIARLSAPDYQSVQFKVSIDGRMLNAAKGFEGQADIRVDYNMIGVRFKPKKD
ncbi:MAG: hypothetical protein ACPGCS_02880 [Opitutales bacterium]